MISKNKKRLEITLATEDEQLLKSLSSRFNITKSQVIKQALKIFAAKHKHVYKIYIEESKQDNNIQVDESTTPEDWNKILN